MAANKARVLIVDDDADLLQMLAIRIRRAGYEVTTAADGRAALAALDHCQPHVVVTDLRMEQMDGMALLRHIREARPTLSVVMLTAHGTIPDAVAAVSNGAFAFLTKPFDPDLLLARIAEAVRLAGADAQGASAADAWSEEIVTRSPCMREMLAQARLAARADVSIVIQSDSGTGKELLARAIHRASPRSSGPFVAVNCTAIPETLFESELFGFVKGSFSGAAHDRQGLLQSANGGTLLLDEIGDMPLHFQAKLLRALEQREVLPVGGRQPVAIDARIVAATHQDLDAAVAAGRFREDLYYRLSVVVLEIPPLSARKDDIPLLAEHFLEAARHDGNQARAFAPEAKAKLLAAPWPGNVRQLKNVVEQCVVLCDAPVISAALVERALRGKTWQPLPLNEARERFEREYLDELLRATSGRMTVAARVAGRNRSEFYKLLAKHGLDPRTYRHAGAGDAAGAVV